MPANSVPSATALTFEEWWGASNDADRILEKSAMYAWNARQPEIDTLRDRERRLREYAVHHAGCASVIAARECAFAKCNCGLAELLAAKEGE